MLCNDLSASNQRPRRFSERDGGLILHLSEKVFEHFAEVARLEAGFTHRFEQVVRFFSHTVISSKQLFQVLRRYG